MNQKGWTTTSLGDLGRLVSGAGFPERLQHQKGLVYPFFKVGNLGKVVVGEALITSDHTVDEEIAQTLGAYIIPPDSIAFAKIGMAIRLNRRRLTGVPCCIDNNLMAVVPSGAVLPRYLLRFLETIDFMPLTQATTVPALRKSDLELLEVPLPPLNEQRRIVAKLEKLLSRVNAAQLRLATTPHILKRFRQSVLAAACSGQLTSDWREGNPNTKPVSSSVESNNLTNNDQIPRTWGIFRVDDIISDLKYGTSQKCSYEKRGVPVLRIPNIGDGIIDSTDLKYAKLPKREFERLKLLAGDILLIRSNGSVSLVGKSAIVRKVDCGFAYAGYLIRLRPNQSHVVPEFLNLALASYNVRLQIEVPARSTSGVNNINSDEIRALEIFIPPIDEQQEIVCRVEALFKKADALEARYRKAKAHVDKLTQSILAKAFRGELVPQDPNDEPASVLLEQIRRLSALANGSSRSTRKGRRQR